MKRISAQSSDLHSPYPSLSAPSELEYTSAGEHSGLLSRPTLFTRLNPSGNDATGPDTRTASQSADERDTLFAVPVLPSQQTSAALLTVPRNFLNPGMVTSPAPVVSSSQKQTSSMSVSPFEIARTPVINTTAKHQTPLPTATVHQSHSSYAALRALQERLMTSLSNLRPPDMTNALFRVKRANSHSVNAFTTAHRSLILAQQSVATAQEAVTAAQECLGAAEQARTHANDALTMIRQLHSGKVGFDVEGSAEWEWEVNYIQLQDDLRMLGEWLVQKESEDTRSRDAQCAHTRDKNVAEAVSFAMEVPGSDSIVNDSSSEVSQIQSGSVEASRVTRNSDLPYQNLNNKGSLKLDADVATKARSSEQSPALRVLPPAATESVPMEVDVGYAEHLPPSDGEEEQLSAKFNETLPLTCQRQDTVAHLSQDEANMRVSYEEARLRKLDEKSEAAISQKSQLERVSSEVSKSTVNGLLSMEPTADRNNDTLQEFQSQNCVIIEDTERALQMQKDKEVAFGEAVEHNRESHRVPKELKQRQLDELEKERDQLAADKEQELIAEQERRRQEVMAQKQRANAEVAARINAERAREGEKAMVASLKSPTSSTPQPSLPDCTVESEGLAPKKIATFQPTKSLSDGDRSGPNTNGQVQLTIASETFSQPSLAMAGSVALRLPSSTAKAAINTGLKSKKAGNLGSSENISQDSSMVSLRTSTSTNGTNGGEELHAYRQSNDPGNLFLVPRSQFILAPPEVQAANLRFLKKKVRWDTSTSLDLKPDSEHLDKPSPHQKSSVKEELPIPEPLVGSQRQIEPEPLQSVYSSPVSLPAKPSSASLPSMGLSNSDQDISVDQRDGRGNAEAISASSITGTSSTVFSSNTQRPLSNAMPPNPHRHDLSSPRKNFEPLLPSPNVPLTTPLATQNMTAIDPIPSSGGTQTAPVVLANCDRIRPVDDVYSGDFVVKVKEPTPPRRPRRFCRGDDNYSPPRVSAPNPYASRGYAASSSIPPVHQSSGLGKRRQREDVQEDERRPHRDWSTDRTRRTRSPPPYLVQSVQGRSTSPDCFPHQARKQDADHPDISCVRPPPSREPAWRSLSPNRPPLQARIGVPKPVVHTINGSQSYRPTYSSDVDERARSSTRDDYPVRRIDLSAPGHRWEPEPRGPYYNHSRGSMSNNWDYPRRGPRRGNQSLNLERRIASSKPLTLINRLESPQRD